MLNFVEALIQRPIKAVFPVVRAEPTTFWGVLFRGFSKSLNHQLSPPTADSRSNWAASLLIPWDSSKLSESVSFRCFLSFLSGFIGKYPRNSPQSEHLRLSSPGFSPAPLRIFSLPQWLQEWESSSLLTPIFSYATIWLLNFLFDIWTLGLGYPASSAFVLPFQLIPELVTVDLSFFLENGWIAVILWLPGKQSLSRVAQSPTGFFWLSYGKVRLKSI